MKIQMDKKKWAFTIIALVLVVVLIVASVMSCGSRDKIIDNTDADLSSDFTSDIGGNGDIQTDKDGTQTDDGDAQIKNGNKKANQVINNVPKTNKDSNDGKHLNDLNNLGGKATLKNNCYSTGYPIADKTVTFKVMIKDYTNQANYNKMKINSFLADKMNIKIQWELVNPGDVATKLQLAYASGNLPDMFIGMQPGISHWDYIKQGLVIQLDDYINKYAPNIKRILDTDPDARSVNIFEDNHYYSLPMVNKGQKVIVWEGLYINKVWLNNLKLGIPTSTNSFMKVLTAFKNNDPNGNGKADEIPLLLQSGNTAGPLPACLYGPFGLTVYDGFAGFSIDDNGKYRANYTTTNFKTAMTYYSTLYKNGLINSDWFGLDGNAFKSKLNSKTNKVGAFVTSAPYSLMEESRVDDYVLVPAFRDKSVEKATWSISGQEYAIGDWFLITKACKYPEVAIRMADYFYSLEGTLTALTGPQGYNWNVKKDGTIYMTQAFYTGKYQSSALTPGYSLPNYQSDSYYELTDTLKSKYTSEYDKKVIKAATAIKDTYIKVAPKNIITNIRGSSADSTGDVDINNLINYVRTSTVQFLNGTTDINLFWDNYVNVCKSLGSDIVVSTRQRSYDNYLKQKKQSK